MIKRSAGFFKIAFFVFCLFIALFLISFSLTDIRNYVTAEVCIFSFCVSITILPMVLEWIVYILGIVTKCIRVSSKEETIGYKSMKNSKVPYTRINDNGTEKMMFFCEKGRIVLLTADNTQIHWGSNKDEIHIKTKFGECRSFFKNLYGIKYDNIECDVYTVLKEDGTTVESAAVIQENTAQQTAEMAHNPNYNIPNSNVQSQPQSQPINVTQMQNTNPSQSQHNPYSQLVSDVVPSKAQERPAEVEETFYIQQSGHQQQQQDFNMLEIKEGFDYSLNDGDTLFEETINI